MRDNGITRRGFIGSIAALSATPLLGKGDWFQDVRMDRWYSWRVLGKRQYFFWQDHGWLVREYFVGNYPTFNKWGIRGLGYKNLRDGQIVLEQSKTPTNPRFEFEVEDEISINREWIEELYRRHKDDYQDLPRGYLAYRGMYGTLK